MGGGVKPKIKGFAKTTGKFILKGGAKAGAKIAELSLRGGVRAVNALVKSPTVHRVTAGAGILAASVMIPSVGVALLTIAGTRYLINNVVLENGTGISGEINSILNAGSRVTRMASRPVSRLLNMADRSLKAKGKDWQTSIDTNPFFR